MNLTLPKGAKARMDAVLALDEDRLDLIRSAIDREVRRRVKHARGAGGLAALALLQRDHASDAAARADAPSLIAVTAPAS